MSKYDMQLIVCGEWIVTERRENSFNFSLLLLLFKNIMK